MLKTEQILEDLKKKLSEDPEIDRLKDIVKKNPNNPDCLFALAKYQIDRNLHEDAIANLFSVTLIFQAYICCIS